MTMDGVLKLYFGESNLPTPEFLKQAAAKAMRDGFTYYTPNSGLLSTRRALACYYLIHQGVELNPENELVAKRLERMQAGENTTQIPEPVEAGEISATQPPPSEPVVDVPAEAPTTP